MAADMFGTIADYKTLMGVSGSSLDTLYTALLTYVTSWIQQETKQRWIQQINLVEYHNPRNVDFIVTRQRPLYSVASLYYDPTGLWGQGDNAFAAGTILVAGSDYAIKYDAYDSVLSQNISKCCMIYLLTGEGKGRYLNVAKNRLNGALASAQGTLKLTYTCGYPATNFPQDLLMATYLLARQLEISAKRAGYWASAEGTKHYNYSMSEVLGIETRAANTIRKYKGKGLSFV